MNVIDPSSRASFKVGGLARLPWIARPLSRFWLINARAAARRMDWTNAAVTYLGCLRLTPCNGPTWVQLGHMLDKLQRPDAAQVAYLNATRVNPGLALGHKHLGLTRYQTSLREEGLDSLACALLLDPLDKELRELMLDEEDEAKVEARLGVAALILADDHPSPAYIGARATLVRLRARRSSRQRNWPLAEKTYRRLTQMRPHDAHAYIQLGHALNEQGKLVGAEEAYRQAAAVAPLLPDAWLHLGYVLTARKQHPRAREAFSFVNRIAPARSRTHPTLKDFIYSPALIIQKGESSAQNRGLRCPDGLNDREKAIWTSLAFQIESRH